MNNKSDRVTNRVQLAATLCSLTLVELPAIPDAAGERDWHVYFGQRFVGGLEWRVGELRASRGGDRRTLVRLVGQYNSL